MNLPFTKASLDFEDPPLVFHEPRLARYSSMLSYTKLSIELGLITTKTIFTVIIGLLPKIIVLILKSRSSLLPNSLSQHPGPCDLTNWTRLFSTTMTLFTLPYPAWTVLWCRHSANVTTMTSDEGMDKGVHGGVL